MQKFIQYLKDVRTEMIKVSWPNREEIIGGTSLVVTLSIFFATVVWIFDQVLNRLLSIIVSS
ncbi:MAG: preprotein translocase subunit SecE [Chitinivibrionales bacterium]|nr:preprotein translocase subunit SecE [Chitinivibrionales bacterium]